MGAQAALNLLANPERLLSVTQMGVTLASLGLGWAGEDTLYQMVVALLHPVITPVTEKALHVASFILAFLVMSYFHVVVGEVVPKNLAIDNADRLAVIVAPALLLFYRISEPFVWIIEKSSSWIIETVGTKSQERGGGHSAEELKLIVSSSRGLGHLPQMQEDIIHRVLDLDNVYVREIMVPRKDIISISDDAFAGVGRASGRGSNRTSDSHVSRAAVNAQAPGGSRDQAGFSNAGGVSARAFTHGHGGGRVRNHCRSGHGGRCVGASRRRNWG